MEGFEKEWNEVDSTRRYVTYTHLAPGDYVFRVIGSNNDRIWNEEGASIQITVTPPWWQTMWFRISMAVVAIGLLAGGFRWRVSAIEARSRELEIEVQRMTQIRQAERALQESEEKFKTLVTNTEEIVFMVDKNGTFLLSEGKGLAILGLKPGQVVGTSVFELYKDYPQMLAEMRQTFDGETVTNEVNVDGNYFRNWYTPHKNHEGKIIGILGLSVNITEQKQAEQRLQSYQQRLKALASQLTITEEKERSAIAADLHDHVGQSLALARMQLNGILAADSVLKRTILVKDVSNILLKTLQDTRHLIFELSSPAMNEIGLAAAISEWLEEHITKYHDPKTEFIDDIDDNHRKSLDSNVRALLFRNVRELLTNVIKHSRAHNVRVRLISEGTCIKIIVEDDGVGFDPDAVNTIQKQAESFGLFSIQERMADLGGSFDIQSHPGKGCRVTLISPPIAGKEKK